MTASLLDAIFLSETGVSKANMTILDGPQQPCRDFFATPDPELLYGGLLECVFLPVSPLRTATYFEPRTFLLAGYVSLISLGIFLESYWINPYFAGSSAVRLIHLDFKLLFNSRRHSSDE